MTKKTHFAIETTNWTRNCLLIGASIAQNQRSLRAFWRPFPGGGMGETAPVVREAHDSQGGPIEPTP